MHTKVRLSIAHPHALTPLLCPFLINWHCGTCPAEQQQAHTVTHLHLYARVRVPALLQTPGRGACCVRARTAGAGVHKHPQSTLYSPVDYICVYKLVSTGVKVSPLPTMQSTIYHHINCSMLSTTMSQLPCILAK